MQEQSPPPGVLLDSSLSAGVSEPLGARAGLDGVAAEGEAVDDGGGKPWVVKVSMPGARLCGWRPWWTLSVPGVVLPC